MIISHKHKYVFVEFPRTGTTSVSRELCQMYGGKRILRKHSTYQEFLKVATPEEKDYFVFTCIRNPLDDAVSHFFKLKTDHRERYTQPQKARNVKRLSERLDAYFYRHIQHQNMDFATFFRKFYIIPYNNWSSMTIKRYNYVMRFENLEFDFTGALKMIGIEPARPLPYRNVTMERKKEFWTYYTPEIIPRARRIFGPFMKQWGYEFPEAWGNQPIPWWNEVEFEFFTFWRQLYWGLLRERV